MAEEPEFKRVERQAGVIFLVRTKRFQHLMDSLGARKISKPISWFLLFLLPVACALGLFIFLNGLAVLFSPRGAAAASFVRTLSPLSNLALPGINPYFPIFDGYIAIIVAVIIHEGAHGVVARSLGLPVKSSGLMFFFFIPIGAFVEPDETALRMARTRDSERVLGAGAGINLVVGMVCLLLLLTLVSSMTPAVNGIGVQNVVPQVQEQGIFVPTPAASAGIMPGDFITAVNGMAINDPHIIPNSTWYSPGTVINITIWRQGNFIQLNDVKLASRTFINTQTNKTYQVAFLGVNDIGYSDLQGKASDYANSFFKTPLLYIACLPTFPACQDQVPFSDSNSQFYTSPAGNLTAGLANLLFWLFFINVNLAIFNALPIYPLDGGQAYRFFVKAVAGGRLSEEKQWFVVVATTFLVIGMLFLLIAGPYLHLF